MIWANVRHGRRGEGLVPSIENEMEGSSCRARTCGWNAIHSRAKVRTGTDSAITRVRALPAGRAGNAVRVNVTKDRLLENVVRVLFCPRRSEMDKRQANWPCTRQLEQSIASPKPQDHAPVAERHVPLAQFLGSR